MSILQVMVVGSGLMGSGISQVLATGGIDVILVDQNRALVERGFSKIQAQLDRKVSKGEMTEAVAREILSRISISDTVSDGKQADLVIEAIPEKLQLKQELFSKLDEIVQPKAILATNTSSLSIASIGASTSRPEKVIGLHFFSPVPVMQLTEIIPSLITSKETVDIIEAFTKRIGKDSIMARDYPGFTVNRLLVPFLNEAICLVFEGNQPKEIDRGMRIGANHPLGPLQLADQIGLDVLLDVLISLYEGYNDPKYRPCPLLKRMVESGQLGRKSGIGFYSYH